MLLHEPDDFPEHMRHDFEEIARELTAVEPIGDEGSAAASTSVMSDIRASEIAKKIVSMYDDITRMYAVETDRR